MAEIRNPNLTEIRDINSEMLVRGIIEQTKANGLLWDHTGGTSYKATHQTGSVIWEYYLSRYQYGGTNRTYRTVLDVRKNGTFFMSTTGEDLTISERSSGVDELFHDVDTIVLERDRKLRELNNTVLNMPNCRT